MENSRGLPPAKSGKCPECNNTIVVTGRTQEDADRNYANALERHKDSEYCLRTKKK